MIVVDASVAVKWGVDEPGRTEALRVLELNAELAAPDLIFPELANVLRKKIKAGEVTPEQASRAIDAVRVAVTTIIGTAELSRDALDMAQELDHSAYDCFYLAAAYGRRGILLTADDAFVRKCGETRFAPFVSSHRDIDPSGSHPSRSPTAS